MTYSLRTPHFPALSAPRTILVLALLAACVLGLGATPAFARPGNGQGVLEEAVVPQRYANNPDVDAFISDLAARDGFDRAALAAVFQQVAYSRTAAKLAAPPAVPGRKNWQVYQSRFLDSTRINAGVRFWENNADTLRRASRQFGVPPGIIVAIIGIETIYGRNMGNFRTIDALTTLAFDYPPAPNRDARMAMFRSELENFLVWTRDQHIDPFSVYGSYAGAVGIPQFMPSSIRAYALDYDGDGKIDLSGSAADAIGSIANFLQQHGWQNGRPVVWHIGNDTGSRGLAQAGWDGQPEPHWTLGNFIRAGMTMNEPGLDINSQLDTPVLVVDLPTPDQPTQYVLGLQNFYVLTRYNRSFFYAMAVYELAQALTAAQAP